MIDLEKNNIREAGGVALAGGLALNTSVRVVNLLSQQQTPGDAVCVAFVELFDTNVTLLKVRSPDGTRSRPWRLSLSLSVLSLSLSLSLSLTGAAGDVARDLAAVVRYVRPPHAQQRNQPPPQERP